MPKVVIVENNPIIRDGLRTLLNNSDSAFECIATFPNTKSIVNEVEDSGAEFVLVDIEDPKMKGLSCIRKLHKNFPSMNIIALTVYEENELLSDAIKLGADGYIMKSMPSKKIIETLRKFSKGNMPINSYIASKSNKKSRIS